MRQGLFLSGLLHGGLVLASAYSLQLPISQAAREPQPLSIELASMAELTKLKAGSAKSEANAGAKAVKKETRAKPKRTGSAKKKSVRKPKPKTKQKSAARAAAHISPKQEAEALLGLKKGAKSSSAATPKKVATNRMTAQSKKSKFNPDKIAALLNKVPDTAPGAGEKRTAQGHADGRDATMTISEIDALRARISQCWSPPVAGLGADSISVKLRMKLKRDGTLATTPTLVTKNSSPVFRAAADSAIRAVWQCQPYILPAAKFALWQDMILNFDPREMIGG